MTSHLLNANLPKPDALDDEFWLAIEQHFNRLKHAVSTDDKPLIVGTAKDLVECTASIVLNIKGRMVEGKPDYAKTIKSAHEAVERQTGEGLSAHAAVRAAAGHAKKLALELNRLRNTYGTGHGRSTVPVIEDEVLETSIDGALLWTRWVLRRLGHIMIGAPDKLARDLRQGEIFYTGDLSLRLEAADLPNLTDSDQHLIGVEVGRRASRNTFNVRIEGIDHCVESPDDSSWPAEYRRGVAEGLFLNDRGDVHVDEAISGPELAIKVLSVHPDQSTVIHGIYEAIVGADWTTNFMDSWQQVIQKMHHFQHLLRDPEARKKWSELADYFEREGETRTRDGD